MNPEGRLKEIVTKELDNLGYDLVRLEISFRGRKNILRIYIDRQERNVTLDDCVLVTRAVGFVLDSEKELFSGPYNLEVSSPGINRPLTKAEHFERFRGKEARIEHIIEDQRKETLIGEIVESDGESVRLSVDGIEKNVTFDEIIRANLYNEKWDIPRVKSGRKKSRSKRS